ncbi:hypothetical protein [Cyclobacterium sediminis]
MRKKSAFSLRIVLVAKPENAYTALFWPMANLSNKILKFTFSQGDKMQKKKIIPHSKPSSQHRELVPWHGPWTWSWAERPAVIMPVYYKMFLLLKITQ